MELDGRTVSGGYRYGFQNQEKDDEVKGEGNSVKYTFRMHDPRLGRFFAVDPLSKCYPYYSQYVFSGNRIIDCFELEGLEPSNYRNRETGEIVEDAGDYSQRGNSFEVDWGNGEIYHFDYVGPYLKIEDEKIVVLESTQVTFEKSNNPVSPEPNIAEGFGNLTPKENFESLLPGTGSVMKGLENFADNGQKLTKGNNGKFYKSGWMGNQYVTSSKYFDEDLLKPIAKNAPLVGSLCDAFEICEAIYQDKGLGNETCEQSAGLVGGSVGTAVGTEIGIIVGTLICPGLGTTIGGALGAGFGNWIGEKSAEYGFKKYLESKNSLN